MPKIACETSPVAATKVDQTSRSVDCNLFFLCLKFKRPKAHVLIKFMFMMKTVLKKSRTKKLNSQNAFLANIPSTASLKPPGNVLIA